MTIRIQSRLIAAFLVLFVAGCQMFSSGPADTVEDFYRHVEDGDISQATELLSPSLVAEYGDKMMAALGEQSAEIQRMQGISSITVVSETVMGEMAEVVTNIVFGDGTARTDTTMLIREDGEWRITMDK